MSELALSSDDTLVNIDTEHDDTISVASLQSRASTQSSMAATQITTPDTWTQHAEDIEYLNGSMSSLPSYNEVSKALVHLQVI